MIIKNAVIFDSDFNKRKLDIKIENGKISDISENLCGEDAVDYSDCTVLPGFIDIHIHGTNNGDTCDKDASSIDIISKNLVGHGVTSFCPTTMTLSYPMLETAFSNVASYMGKENGAYIHGINMEGPYISYAKKGAQDGQYVRAADIDEFKRLYDVCKVSLVDVAPEIENAIPFAQEISEICTVSAAHSNTSFEDAEKGFKNGFSHATHLFNAMTGLTARNPGLIGAVFDSDFATAELICDGFHISPSNLRLAFKMLGEDRSVIISDALRSADLPDGEYNFAGQMIYVKDGKALLEDGTIAGSSSNMYEEYINALSFGIPEKQVVKSCTINPARVIGADDITGSIEIGKNADLLILDKDNKIRNVIVKGKVTV